MHLNADRELLVLFSDYSNFEIRTLEAYDEFYAQLDQQRVDKSIRFLVSADPRIEEIIRHYLNQNPEYPIIIPIYLGSFKGRSDIILTSLRRNYVLRDLFGYQNPLREETFFFGRQAIVNAVLDSAKSGQSSSILGLRKSGKTSAIYAIMRRAKSFGIIPIMIDCQNPAIHGRQYEELLRYIIGEIRKSLGQKQKIEILGDNDVEVSESFSQQMKSALGHASRNILLIFDEIENISPDTAASEHWRNGRDTLLFWQNIRSFVQAESKGALSLCLVGTNPHLLEVQRISSVANPMYLFAQKSFIPPFSYDETRSMIDQLGFFMGLSFSPEQIATLVRVYGGHPFFMRQVCSQVHSGISEKRPITISDARLEEAILSSAGQLDRYMTEIIHGLRGSYPEEYALLEAIVNDDTDEAREYAKDAPELIDHLLGYGLVARRGEDVEISVGAIKTALIRVFQPVDDAAQRWAEISRRRNKLETELRRELLSWSRYIEAREFEGILERCLSKKRFEALSSLVPRFLFSNDTSELFFSDIMMLLKDPAVCSYLGERRQDVVIASALINKVRTDAHAKNMTSDDMAKCRKAFDLLEAEFVQ
ncbi:AAA-like domain-containing protein [Jannaschia sp. KMU-145]|uniref:AAA-like domain-containing protein n=1 Tax=Jannaschia halovivens TaxID=3388667 RepID=UPI00396B3247